MSCDKNGLCIHVTVFIYICSGTRMSIGERIVHR
jgi:hypothetical protein